MALKRIVLGSPVGFIESIKRWMGLSGTLSTQLAFGPLEVGDVLTLESGGKAVGTVRVIEVPSISSRPLVGKLPKNKKYPRASLPPDQRKTGHYTFLNIDVPFNGDDRPFYAFYSGKSLTCESRVFSHVYGIREVRQVSGKVLRARFKRVRPSWTRLSQHRLHRANSVAKVK